jgi:hypothetical protein
MVCSGGLSQGKELIFRPLGSAGPKNNVLLRFVGRKVRVIAVAMIHFHCENFSTSAEDKDEERISIIFLNSTDQFRLELYKIL